MTCPSVFAKCSCALPVGHDGPHECNDPSAYAEGALCMGVWIGDRAIVRYPTGANDLAAAFTDSVLSTFGEDELLAIRVLERAAAAGKLVTP